jgi:signal transduction histidine kinase/DNA-binding response OmpR family regulator
MIELGHIRLEHRTAVHDARNKIRSLVNTLGYDAIESTRLTIAVSEAARVLGRASQESRITVSLGTEASSPHLTLDFMARDAPPKLTPLLGFFDHSRAHVVDGFEGIRVMKRLPNSNFELTEEFVAEQSARIKDLSREELMDEIQQKNRELEQHSAELEQTVTQRTEELKRAMHAAEDASSAKSGFLANMSHELRTPMNAIIGYSEMLMEDAEDDGNSEVVDDLKKIHSAGRHLLSLINDVLDISKIEAGKTDLYLETFEIDSLVEGVVSTVDTLIKKNGNRLSVEVDPALESMHADVTKVRQALFNLLSNAAKFTREGVIGLHVRGDVVEGERWIQISVSDSGIGIPSEKVEHVFEEFSQADGSTTRNYGGTGLGLAISRRFCRMMGGDISVTSVLGEGSTFTIHLPAVVQEVPEDVDLPEDSSAVSDLGDEPVVLVIDDDPSARELLRRMLEGVAVQIVTAKDGRGALDLARSLHPVAITLDVLMPEMDGWEVLSELKADPETRDIPVIIVTMTNDRNLGFALGATEFLTKPVRREDLSEILGRFVTGNGAHDALVVDDEPENRELMRRTLEGEGWRVREAENGRVALDEVATHPPSLILLDLMMPVMDGFEFVLEMRRRDPANEIPIVVVTAKDVTEEERRRLSGSVLGMIERGGLDQDSLVELLREQVAAMTARKD